MYVYRTKFNLVYPVKDYKDATDYLKRSSRIVSNALKGDSSILGEDSSNVKSIEWVLEDEYYPDNGYIELITYEKLEPSTLSKISEWVRGQNSDGLGEGFEQQQFAERIVGPDGEVIEPDKEENYYDLAEEENSGYSWEMASFCWKSDSYEFELYDEYPDNED